MIFLFLQFRVLFLVGSGGGDGRSLHTPSQEWAYLGMGGGDGWLRDRVVMGVMV